MLTAEYTEIHWHEDRLEADRFYLSGDIGGTNTNLAIVGERQGQLMILLETVTPSKKIDGLMSPLQHLIALAQERNPRLSLELICLSGAGPVADNFCDVSNLSWDIDGAAIEQALGIRTLVINDFLAISYGVPLLDTHNPEHITPLPHTDSRCPEPTGMVSLVIGAGTGLGVSFIVHGPDGTYHAYPSEGGHASFADFDAETAELTLYLSRHSDFAAEIESFVSGIGIVNIFHYFRDVRRVGMDRVLKEVMQAPLEKQASLISKHAHNHPVCRDIMRLFVKIYGRISADFATILLPMRGIYLAGGIVAKNEDFFLEGKQFMYYFEQNFRPNVQEMLKNIPAYIIRNYSISLLGAANAGRMLTR
ncbi:MAG: Glucokinase [Puniceicoccaceae bacterium 5H]|nr:MAG: Glucokinase [Puniceicoccaceae bacterium 5H]